MFNVISVICLHLICFKINAEHDPLTKEILPCLCAGVIRDMIARTIGMVTILPILAAAAEAKIRGLINILQREKDVYNTEIFCS